MKINVSILFLFKATKRTGHRLVEAIACVRTNRVILTYDPKLVTYLFSKL